MNLPADADHSCCHTRRRWRIWVALLTAFVAGTIVLFLAVAWFIRNHDLSPVVRPFCTRERRDAIDTLRKEGLEVYYLCWHYRRNGWEVLSRNDPSLDDAKMARVAPHLRLLEPNIVFLTDNNIGDSGVTHLSNINSIEFLDLGWTRTGDGGVKAIATLPLLKELYLNNTRISDAGLVDLETLNTLKLLAIGQTRVTEQGMRDFSQAAPNVYIDNSRRGR